MQSTLLDDDVFAEVGDDLQVGTVRRRLDLWIATDEDSIPNAQRG